jgi:hypothetical protein
MEYMRMNLYNKRSHPAFADLLAEQVLWQARAAPAYTKPALRRA